MLPPVLTQSRRRNDHQRLRLADFWIVLGIWLVLAASVALGSLAVTAT